MSVCKSKNTETKKNMRLLKRIYLFPIFFSSENSLIRLIYWFFLRKKKKTSDQLNWSIEEDFMMQSCCLLRKIWREDVSLSCAQVQEILPISQSCSLYTHWNLYTGKERN